MPPLRLIVSDLEPNNWILIALINPTALPALRIAGGVFLIIYLLAGAYNFGTGDNSLVATRRLSGQLGSPPHSSRSRPDPVARRDNDALRRMARALE